MTTTELELISVDKLVPYVNNARTHSPEQIQKLRASLREFGFINPVIIDREYNVIAGHGRIMAAQAEGIEEVPCVYADHLTEAQKKAYILADNRMALDAGWDEEMLRNEILALQEMNFNIGLTGFEDSELADLILDLEEPAEEDNFDVAEELPEEPTSKPGQVYKLGRHRLICGDSTDVSVISKLMCGNQADMWLTDPPYNVNYEGSTGMTIKNDNMEDSRFRAFLVDAFKAAVGAMKPGAAFYIWHADSEGYNFRGACRDVGLQVRQCLVWVKNSLVLGRQDYQWRHEPCLYGWKDGASHYFIDNRKQTTVIEDYVPDFGKMKKEEMKALLEEIYSDRMSTTVIYEDKPLANDLHPTMKPIKLLARLIRNSSKPDDIVLDTFGGSGSTLMACEQLGRTCYTCELDPKYVDVIINRWEDYTGQKAELIEG